MKPNFLIGITLLGLACWACQVNPNTEPSVSPAPMSSTPTSDASDTMRSVPSELPGIPEKIQGYTRWLKMNPKPIPPDSGAPHTPSGGVKNVFVSPEPLSGEFPYAEGTVIVKEALHKTDGFVELLAVMRKQKGVDAEHGDWIFEEYTRSSATEPLRLAFQGAICWGCHAKAKATDWSFTQIIKN